MKKNSTLQKKRIGPNLYLMIQVVLQARRGYQTQGTIIFYSDGEVATPRRLGLNIETIDSQH